MKEVNPDSGSEGTERTQNEEGENAREMRLEIKTRSQDFIPKAM